MLRKSLGPWALVCLLGWATTCPGQMGGFGGGMGGGDAFMPAEGFGNAGEFHGKPSRMQVKVTSTTGKTTTGVLEMTTVVIGSAVGIDEVRPEKVQEIRFVTATDRVPFLIIPNGMSKGGSIVTTSGETIDGCILIPSWWRVETELGSLKPSPQGIKTIEFVARAEPPTAEPSVPAPASDGSPLRNSSPPQ